MLSTSVTREALGASSAPEPPNQGASLPGPFSANGYCLYINFFPPETIGDTGGFFSPRTPEPGSFSPWTLVGEQLSPTNKLISARILKWRQTIETVRSENEKSLWGEFTLPLAIFFVFNGFSLKIRSDGFRRPAQSSHLPSFCDSGKRVCSMRLLFRYGGAGESFPCRGAGQRPDVPLWQSSAPTFPLCQSSADYPGKSVQIRQHLHIRKRSL